MDENNNPQVNDQPELVAETTPQPDFPPQFEPTATGVNASTNDPQPVNPLTSSTFDNPTPPQMRQ